MTSYSDEENAKFVALYRGSLIPLHAVREYYELLAPAISQELIIFVQLSG